MSSAVAARPAISVLAGCPALKDLLVGTAELEWDYYGRRPDLDNPCQLVSFGTSGHRGTPARGTFTEAHVLAIAQAISDYRNVHAIDGPLYLGKDTHALSGPAQRTAIEVLAANAVETVMQHSPVTPEQKTRLENLSPEAVRDSSLVGEPITAKLIRAPGNNSPIGGLKVVASSGWFAARPSGTENIYKIYAESFQGVAHLDAIVSEAQEMVNRALST